MEESPRQICFRKNVSSGACGGELPSQGSRSAQTCPRPGSPSWGILTLDDKALFVNTLLICNFENKIETSCILKYKMKCDALYTI